MTRVTIVKKEGIATVVRYVKDGELQAAINYSPSMMGKRVGDEVEIDDAELAKSVEYGIEWSIVFPQHLASLDKLTQSLRAHGVWTDLDLIQQPNQAIAAINSYASTVYMLMLDYTKQALSGENHEQ